MIEIYAAPDFQAQADAIAADLATAYPGFFEVATLSQGAEPFLHRVGQPAWDDLLILLFGVDTLPPHLQAPIQREIDAATRGERACRVLPISTLADRPIPPAPLNQVKALTCLGSGSNERGRIVRRVGALLGLWLRDDHRKVFVSHRQSDGKALAAQVAQYLKDNGYDAWLDAEELRGAEIVQQEIVRSVADAHLLLLLDTPQAKQSEWILKEIDAAIYEFVPIFDLILRPAGAELQPDDILPHYQLHHQRIDARFCPDESCELRPEDALARLLAAAESHLVEILRLQMSLVTKTKDTFKAAGFDWIPVDDRRRMYRAAKPDGYGFQVRILSHCSPDSPTVHQTVRAFQNYRTHLANNSVTDSPPANDPYNYRIFLYDLDKPLARPILERLVRDHGFGQDALLRILNIAGLERFLRRYSVGTEV